MSKRVVNFSAGPAVMPVKVLEQAQRAVVELDGQGMSILEISHRSKLFDGILAESKVLLRELLDIPEGYSILFLQGGSSLQFSMVPMNFLRGTGQTADYIPTGSWGSKAFEEAKREGTARSIWEQGNAANFSHLPDQGELKFSPGAAYAHITSNETIQGVEFPSEPDTGSIPLVCDASSNFLSRPVAVDRYGLIYACAQKNAGIAGVTVVIVRDELLARVPKGLPPMLDYRLQAENDSHYNTPPVFAVYVLMLVCRWLKNDIGGLAEMAQINRQKAKLLYDVLDEHPSFYRGHARADSRSMMNVTWRLPSEELEAAFVKGAQARGLVDLKGHRSVGGIRASIYNAMPREGVVTLRDYMLEFRKQRG
ncbi:MAG TPA: 3-phosphoserine/phosphohydroxythreonine transaminase [Pirellulales bacterium]|jgi:phosphoserine aminotransferase|nr:3-phosphoserine/phosphohydroxythreonine transaminase [Pirellulales bacterium]